MNVATAPLACWRIAKRCWEAITSGQGQKLDAVLAESGLGTGTVSTAHMFALTAAVDKAEVALRGLL